MTAVRDDVACVTSETLADPLVDTTHGLAVVAVSDLAESDRKGMLEVLSTCYGNVSRAQFERDLRDKEWVVIGRDSTPGDVWLFSTLRRLFCTIDGKPVVAFYSGDSASRPETHGGATSAGMRLLVRKMYGEMLRRPEAKFYWFMISSTYKSYRLLSMVFKTYSPAPDRPLTDNERDLIERLSALKGLEYDRSSGIVRLENPSLPLIPDGGDHSGTRDAIAEYFARANPGASTGDRLASITPLTLENLTSLGRRLLTGSSG
jgi:hypothetical protein